MKFCKILSLTLMILAVVSCSTPKEISYFQDLQPGVTELTITDLVKNADMLEKVRYVARDLIDRDPEMELPEHSELKKRVKKMFGEKIQLRL